ncbi:MAG TPA: sulfotransferase [Crenalkalicoccus sp.]|jgi:hypothetical protein|nr:sulfotransferase [Crenalkalicoccus sp.]
MTLQVIGPGFGRTGTASLKRALEMLGFAPCHHMEEAVTRPEQLPCWQAVAEGKAVDWHAVFAGFRAQVDWPGAACWRELAIAFPDAKVVLSVRPEESWWRSFEATVGMVMRMDLSRLPAPPHMRDMLAAGTRIIEARSLGCRAEDREGVLAAYRRNTAEVQAEIPPARLLVYDVAEGWEPLCRFLGVPVPDEPFPRVNTTEEFLERLKGPPAG